MEVSGLLQKYENFNVRVLSIQLAYSVKLKIVLLLYRLLLKTVLPEEPPVLVNFFHIPNQVLLLIIHFDIINMGSKPALAFVIPLLSLHKLKNTLSKGIKFVLKFLNVTK